jgi:hypothetical protein
MEVMPLALLASASMGGTQLAKEGEDVTRGMGSELP